MADVNSTYEESRVVLGENAGATLCESRSRLKSLTSIQSIIQNYFTETTGCVHGWQCVCVRSRCSNADLSDSAVMCLFWTCTSNSVLRACLRQRVVKLTLLQTVQTVGSCGGGHDAVQVQHNAEAAHDQH